MTFHIVCETYIPCVHSDAFWENKFEASKSTRLFKHPLFPTSHTLETKHVTFVHCDCFC